MRFSGGVTLFFGSHVNQFVMGCETGMVDKELADGRVFAQAFEIEVDTEALLFQPGFPVAGDVIAGMVACHKHQRNKGDGAGGLFLHQAQGIGESGIALHRADMAIGMGLGFQHVVEHGVGCRGGVGRAVPHEEDLPFGLLRADGGNQGFDHSRIISGRIEQGRTHADVFEIEGKALDFAALRGGVPSSPCPR